MRIVEMLKRLKIFNTIQSNGASFGMRNMLIFEIQILIMTSVLENCLFFLLFCWKLFLWSANFFPRVLQANELTQINEIFAPTQTSMNQHSNVCWRFMDWA